MSGIDGVESENWSADVPRGRKLASPSRRSSTVGVLREATEDRLRLVRKHFVEADASDFDVDGLVWTDRATSRRYRVVLDAGPWTSLDPRHARVACFAIADGLIVFLRAEDERVESESSVLMGTMGTS